MYDTSQKLPEAVSGVVKLNIFLGSMPPDPLVYTCYERTVLILSTCPTPNTWATKHLPPPPSKILK